jgi:hypothetical protein
MVDTAPEHRIDYSAYPDLIEGVRHTAGDPRMVQLYLETDAPAGTLERLTASWQQALGTRAWILTRDQAVAAGLFGPVRPEILPRIGDLLIAAREPIALFDTRRASPSALQMVGQHGSLTRAEREVPLLTLARPAKGGRK